MLKDLPEITPSKPDQYTKYSEAKGSPFINSRRIFKLPNHEDPIYQ